MNWIRSAILAFALLLVSAACSPAAELPPTQKPRPPTAIPIQARIQAIYPAEATLPGAIVTLSGENFGEIPGKVLFGDQEGRVISWDDKQIDVKVPPNLNPGKVDIHVAIAAGTDPVEEAPTLPFTVLEPSLASLGLRAAGIYLPAVADYDLDGDLDMFIASNFSENGIDNAYFLNNGNATFSEIDLEEAGFPLQADSFTAATADFDEDGDADLYVVGSGQDFYALNDGDGTFTLQNLAEAGLEMRPDQNGTEKLGIALADFDLDGHIDIFVDIGFSEHIDNFYALNNGDGTFTAVDLAGAGIPTGGDGKYVTAADFNGDGAPDLLVGQMDSPAVYLLNNGDGTFIQQDPTAAGIAGIGAGSQQTVADYDLDGDIDLYIGDTEPADDFASLESYAQNNGDGTFTLIDLEELGLLDPPHQFRGSMAADLNNDGYTDIYQSGTFAPDGFFALNRGDGTFQQLDLEEIGLYTDFTLGLPVAADFDNDGDLDIFSNGMFARNLGDGTFILYK